MHLLLRGSDDAREARGGGCGSFPVNLHGQPRRHGRAAHLGLDNPLRRGEVHDGPEVIPHRRIPRRVGSVSGGMHGIVFLRPRVPEAHVRADVLRERWGDAGCQAVGEEWGVGAVCQGVGVGVQACEPWGGRGARLRGRVPPKRRFLLLYQQQGFRRGGERKGGSRCVPRPQRDKGLHRAAGPRRGIRMHLLRARWVRHRGGGT
mmetsp:Transcript_1096/g.2704  ORF Transcript_1096/g.2704 Transcript_1096/m.2704 type:complete len:204 (+) Transcript_1096:304-915(+)